MKARGTVIALLLCMTFGSMIATLPHAYWWRKAGTPAYFADFDDLGFYSALGSRAYTHHPFELRDSTVPLPGSSVFPWLPLGPGILLARLFRAGPSLIGLIWRLLGGLAMGGAWFLLVRRLVRNTLASAVITLFLLGDIGLLSCWPLLKQFLALGRIAAGGGEDYFKNFPVLHTEWRIMTPALSLPFLLFQTWLLLRARELPSRARIALAGMGFGLLFPVYFYFWTAAGLALALAWKLDPPGRRVYSRVGGIGALCGLPTLATGYHFRVMHAEALSRSTYFLKVPRLGALLFPKMAFLCLALTGAWVWLRKRELLYVWALGLAALLLTNQQIITGRDIENFHWSYVYGPALTLLTVLAARELIGPWLARRRGLQLAAAALLVLHLGGGLALRWFEAGRTRESAFIMKLYSEYRAQKARWGGELPPDQVVAGDEGYQYFAALMEDQLPLFGTQVLGSMPLSNGEVEERIALDSYLNGLDREAYAKRVAELIRTNTRGEWASSEDAKENRRLDLLALYQRIALSPGEAIKRFKVRFVARRVDAGVTSLLPGSWRRIQNGPVWDVWLNQD